MDHSHLMIDSQTLAEVHLDIEGMVCAGCVVTIEKALLDLPGVQEADVNLSTRHAFIQYDSSKVKLEDMLSAIEGAGYHAKLSSRDEANYEEEPVSYRRQKLRLWVAILLSIPILAVTMLPLPSVVKYVFGAYVQFVLTSIVLFWPGLPIMRAAYMAAKRRTSDMNVLVALGTLAAYFYSVLMTFWPYVFKYYGIVPQTYYEAASATMTVILIGRLLDSRAQGRASQAVQKLFRLQPKMATVLRNGEELEIPVDSIDVDDVVRVRPGGRVPVDGSIQSGEADFDESMLTGESLYVTKKEGDPVYGGSICVSGSFLMKVTAIKERTMLAQIIELLERAQSSKAPVQALVDKVTAIFVPVVLLVAMVTLIAWFFIGGLSAVPRGLMASVSVLLISCPCALGLATPIAITVAAGRGAELGILFRNAQAIEKASGIKAIVLDKTGTLTEGKAKMVSGQSFGKIAFDELLKMGGAVELLSEHPFAQAIVRAAPPFQDLEVTGFQSVRGAGVSALIEGKQVAIGSLRWMKELGIDVPGIEIADATPLVICIEKEPLGVFYIKDPIREEAKEVVQALEQRGYEVWMLTGDHARVAKVVADSLGIQHYEAEMIPQQKVAQIESIKSKSKEVAMVGDGINDAPALATSDLGVALGSGTEIAMEAASVTLLRRDLRALLDLFVLSKSSMHIIRQNLYLAFVYNVIAIPIASAGLLNPVIASIAMGMSSLSVVLNALRLRSVAA